MKEDFEFLEKIRHDLEACKAAHKILRFFEYADKGVSKKAYRKVSMKYHRDHNQCDLNTGKKFALINCAYELLARDKPCPKLPEEINVWEGMPEDYEYKLDNLRGHFLRWGEKFFDSAEKKEQNRERSCI